ncbi:hypothetical protein WAI453_007510 [Rhynchosporium graminicola]
MQPSRTLPVQSSMTKEMDIPADDHVHDEQAGPNKRRKPKVTKTIAEVTDTTPSDLPQSKPRKPKARQLVQVEEVEEEQLEPEQEIDIEQQSDIMQLGHNSKQATPPSSPNGHSNHDDSPRHSRVSATSQEIIQAQADELKRMKEMMESMSARLQASEQAQMQAQRFNNYATPYMTGALPALSMAEQPARRGLPPSLRGPPGGLTGMSTHIPTPTPPGFPTYNSAPALTPYSTGYLPRDRPRTKAPPTFTPPKDDLRFWILELEDYMVAEGIQDSAQQAALARDYLHSTIKARIQHARITSAPEAIIFMHWQPLKEWLFKEYGIQTSAIEADIRMTKIKMFENQSVQAFTNFFETLLQDVSWCYEPQSALANYRTKLTKPIFKRIYDANNGILPDNYATMKEQALRAEEYLKTTATLFGEPYKSTSDRDRPIAPARPRRNVTFDTSKPKDDSNPNAIPLSRKPLQDASGNKKRESRYPDIPAEKRKKLRLEQRCFTCEETGHWTSECPKNANPSRR